MTIPAGTAIIGATGSDGLAESAERPAVLRRFWPGFRIGREAVLTTSFERFLDETMRPKQNCLAVVPDKPSPYARCVSAADADAYVAWLTGRTGKRYGLATAAEWEFAAKTAVTPIASLDDVPAAHSLRLGEVKEIVADCWQPFIPSIGNDILAADAGRFLCETRMVKGWTQQDAAKWRRVSVRREREKAAAPPDTGLRVVRSLD